MNQVNQNWQKIALTTLKSSDNKKGQLISTISASLKQIIQFIKSLFIALLIIVYRLIKKMGQNFKKARLRLSPLAFYFLASFLAVILLVDYLFALAGNSEKTPLFFLTDQTQGEKIIIEKKILDDQQSQNVNQSQNSNFKIASLEEEPAPTPSQLPTALGGAALVNSETDFASEKSERTEIETYIVQPGDTISSIAQKFNISTQTILWENKLTVNSILKPNQELRILPINGITHKVKKGDTLESIAKNYKASVEDILDFNNLADANDVHVNDILIVPEGKIPPPPPRLAPKTKDQTFLAKEGLLNKPSGENCHTFIPGQCTWYVARKRCIPWTGHAKSWLSNAQRLGFTISREPAIGAIISLRESSWTARVYGHVGYVESFDETSVTFSEMNYIGPWIITRRTLPRNDSRIIGYIL